jgi:serine protease Do
MSKPNRQFVSFALVLAAVLFGMVLAGGLDLTAPTRAEDHGPIVVASNSRGGGPTGGTVTLPSFADLAQAVDPAVVSVQAATLTDRPQGRRGVDPFEFFFGPRERQPQQEEEENQPRFRSDSSGSGFVISADGLVVTNNHVIRGADEVTVVIEDREFPAEIVGADAATDLALLKIDVGHELEYLALGDSDTLRPGDWVMAVGDPFELENTVTVGVVSAKGRQINISRETSSFENFIQTDAAINFGNSGGPLLNLSGEVVGINTAINLGAENIGFAVPVNHLKTILPQLRENGRVRRGYLGIEIQNLSYESAEAFGLDSTDGALVMNVLPGQPAANAGLRHSDIILEVDGRKVKDTRELIDYVSAQGPDAKVEVVILRDGKRLTKEIQLTERPGADVQVAQAESQEEGSIEWLGLRYQTVTQGLREAHGLPSDVEGVWILSVAPTSPLYDENIRSTGNVIQVITEVNGTPVTNAEEFEALVGAAESGSRLRIYVRRFAGGEEVSPQMAFPAVP